MTDYNKVLSENVKEYFLNEHTSENEFRNMNQTEKMQNLAEYALTEYVNTAKIIDAVFKGNNQIALAGIGKDVSNSAFFKDIERSNGDITKTKHNNDLKDLYEDFINIFNKEVSEIQEGSILSNDKIRHLFVLK